MIDVRNGDIKINDIYLYQGMTLEEFMLKYSSSIIKVIKNPIFEQYRLANQDYNDYSLAISAKFTDSKIKWVSLAPLLGNETNFWDDWSEERELKRLKIYERFIEGEIGGFLKNGCLFFDWGNVYAAYDSKSATVNAGVNYK